MPVRAFFFVLKQGWAKIVFLKIFDKLISISSCKKNVNFHNHIINKKRRSFSSKKKLCPSLLLKTFELERCHKFGGAWPVLDNVEIWNVGIGFEMPRVPTVVFVVDWRFYFAILVDNLFALTINNISTGVRVSIKSKKES